MHIYVFTVPIRALARWLRSKKRQPRTGYLLVGTLPTSSTRQRLRCAPHHGRWTRVSLAKRRAGLRP